MVKRFPMLSICVFLLVITVFQNCAEKELSIIAINSSNNSDSNRPEGPKIIAGQIMACLLNNGNLKCWGDNYFGQLGNGSTITSAPYGTHILQQVLGMDKDVSSAAVGSHQICAIQKEKLFCWGLNSFGQLGNGTVSTGATAIPSVVNGMDNGVTQVAVGFYAACAIKDGALYCWGQNDYGQLGDGTQIQRNTPVAVNNMSSGVTQIAMGDNDDGATRTNHTCAIKSGGLYCWGFNSQGQLGIGSTQNSSTPAPVTGLDSEVTAVAVGAAHTCAIKGQRLYCWGGNGSGQLGVNDTTNRSSPILVGGSLTNKDVSMVVAGKSHTCAVSEQNLFCWGSNSNGQIGMAGVPDRASPYLLSGITSPSSIEASGYNSYAIVGKALYSWGRNDFGQIAVNNRDQYNSPVKSLDIQ